ncbi:MAG: ribonuclease P [Methanobacterium sp.]|nr:ribonuclease P [Methanobacterium sp.]
MRRGRRQKWMIKIAEERVNILFNRAQEELSHNPERSHRHVQMARNIAQKYNLKINSHWNRRHCKSCHKFLQPGVNSQVRLKNSRVEIKCLECGEIRRIPYIREKKERRRKKIEYNTFKKGTNEQIT